MMKWGLWGVYGSCIAGLATIAGRMALKHHRGEGGGHLSSVIMVGAACILAATGPAIIRQLLGI
jgi:uncharacterized membrane protein